MMLDGLPERGWGVLHCPFVTVLVLEGAGLVKVQKAPYPDDWQVRLTGAGRRYRAQLAERVGGVDQQDQHPGREAGRDEVDPRAVGHER